jgi:hypothetical protein
MHKANRASGCERPIIIANEDVKIATISRKAKNHNLGRDEKRTTGPGKLTIVSSEEGDFDILAKAHMLLALSSVRVPLAENSLEFNIGDGSILLIIRRAAET